MRRAMKASCLVRNSLAPSTRAKRNQQIEERKNIMSQSVSKLNFYLSFANNPSGFISRSNTFIAMMEAAEFSDGDDRTLFHNLALDWTLFAESQVWA
jgi:hypothetical protein